MYKHRWQNPFRGSRKPSEWVTYNKTFMSVCHLFKESLIIQINESLVVEIWGANIDETHA